MALKVARSLSLMIRGDGNLFASFQSYPMKFVDKGVTDPLLCLNNFQELFCN